MDEHYIEFTAIIGPIDEPYALHTFDENDGVHRTVHGDLSDRLANAVWAVDHNANVSAHLTTQAEMQARTEGPRLRAVAEAAQTYRAERTQSWRLEDTDNGPAIWKAVGDREADAWSELVVALDQLDGNPNIGNAPVMCRWCHRPIVLLPADDLPIDESAWAHVEPQPGTNRRNQIQCEPDMQSMRAEPAPEQARSSDDPEPGATHHA